MTLQKKNFHPFLPVTFRLDDIYIKQIIMPASIPEIKTLADSINELTSNATDDFREIVGLSTQLNNLLSSSADYLERIGKKTIDLQKVNQQIKESRQHTLSIEQSISEIQQKMTKNEQQISNIISARVNNISKISSSIAELNKKQDAGTLSAKEALALQVKRTELLKKEQSLNDYLKRGYNHISSENIKTLTSLQHQRDVSQQITSALQRDKELARQSNRELKRKSKSLFGIEKILSHINSLPVIGKFLNSEKITQQIAASNKAGNNTFNNIKAGVKAIGADLLTAFSSPVAIIGEMISGFVMLSKAVINWDKTLTHSANTLGLSKQSTQSVYKSFESITIQGKNYTSNLDNGFLSISNQANALNDLNDSFGTSILFTNKTLQNQILLTKQMGMSSDEAANIQKLSLSNNQTAENTLQTIIKQNNGILSYKRVISEVSRVSGQLVAQYKNSPELIAKAVAQVSKLGISLEQAKKASDSLLNFQSSIESELEAELLTGKAIYLEKARALALDGKSAEAAKEMLKQVGSFSDYSKLNVIQQDALAKLIGMSADELTNSLREQQVLNSLGFENKKALQDQYSQLVKNHDQVGLTRLQEELRAKQNGELLLSQISQVSLSQRFQESIEKVKEVFVSLASGPMISILDSISRLLSNTAALKAALIGVSAIAGTIAGTLITTAFIVNPIGAGIGAAIGATIAGGITAAALNAGTRVQDSLISPQGGIQISTPKGMIIPDRNDSVITTTNPDGVLGSKGDNKGIESKLDTMIGLLQKGGSVFMDSTKVGTTQGMSYSAYA